MGELTLANNLLLAIAPGCSDESGYLCQPSALTIDMAPSARALIQSISFTDLPKPVLIFPS
jgi:hypothetical protein